MKKIALFLILFTIIAISGCTTSAGDAGNAGGVKSSGHQGCH